MTIRLRFVTCNDHISALIRWAEDDWRSHVEAVLPDGYLGAHSDGGVKVRQVGYDAAILQREEFVDIPADGPMAALWEKCLRQHVGEPYDFGAILGIVLRADLSQREHVICSALQMKVLIDCGKAIKFPLDPAEISPRDLRIWCNGQIGE